MKGLGDVDTEAYKSRQKFTEEVKVGAGSKVGSGT
jgi:hypothetical protein